MLFHSLYTPRSGVYVGHYSFVLEGEVDLPAFGSAWQYLLDRHPALRTRFAWEGLPEPLQVVVSHVPVPLQHLDWRHLSAQEQRDRLAALAQGDRERGFDLATAPLLRLVLVRLRQDAYHFLWSTHHAIVDGWSMPLILDELWATYEALRRHREPRLEPSRPYGDYVAWLQTQDPAPSEAFWRRLLRGFDAPLALGAALSVDRPATDAAPPERFQERQLALPAAVHQAAQALRGATRSRSPPSSRAPGRSCSAATPARRTSSSAPSSRVARPACRASSRSSACSSIPSRHGSPSPRPPTSSPGCRRSSGARSRHGSTSTRPCRRSSSGATSPRAPPCSKSILVLENYSAENAANRHGEGLVVRDVSSVDQTNYPLTVVVTPERELSLPMSFDPRRFAAPAVERMLAHLGALLERMVARPDQPLSAFALLGDAEREQILHQWNDTAFEYDRALDVPRRVAAWAQRAPHALAVDRRRRPAHL